MTQEQAPAYPPPMMTTHVVSSVSGRSASDTAPDRPDDWSLDDVISDGLSPGSFQVNVEEKEEEDRGFPHYINSNRQPHLVRSVITNMSGMPEGSFLQHHHHHHYYKPTCRSVKHGGCTVLHGIFTDEVPPKNEKRKTSRIEKLTTAIALREKKSQLGVGCIGKLTLPGYHTKWYKKLQEGGEYRQRFRS
jgi:hypothetical protein